MLPRAPGQAPIRTCAAVTSVQQSNLSAIADAVPSCLRFFRPSHGSMLAALLALLVILAPGALAGPHEGGTLILHADPGAVYSAGEAYCGVELTACSLAVVEVPADPYTTTVFHVLAAFPEADQVDLRGVQFGIAYDAQRLVMVAHGSCADFVIPTPGWPASGGGVGMTWGEAQTGSLVDLYWFAGYAYSTSEPTLFEVTPHPVQGGAFLDGTVPGVLDTVAAYGALGFGMPGLLACPDIEEDGGGEGNGGGPEGGIPSADGSVWVKPSGILIVDGVWSSLVKTRALHAVSGMGLRIGSTDYSPTHVVETTDSTAVLTFRYEAAESDTAAFVRFPDGELLQLEILDSAHARTRDQIEGVISIGTLVGAINYPLGARERTLNELEGTDESLLTLLKQLGCRKVSKYEYMKPETLSPEDSLRYNVHTLRTRALLRRGYNAYFDPQFSERSVAFILSDNPMVEHASVATEFRQFGRHDPYAPPNPCFPYQCNAMHSLNHGHLGTGVNYVWGSGGRGALRRIAIVDSEWCLHSGSITYASGDDPEFGPHLEHGLLMALTACAHANSQARIPGFAFEAEVIPVFIRGDDYGHVNTANALLRAIGYGAHVISMSGGHPSPHPELLSAVQDCFDAGIPVVVSKGPDDDGSYPANWDQGSMTPLVLSCNTSRKDGSVYHTGADVYAPGEDLVHPNYGSGQSCYIMPPNETGSFAAPQTAGAIAADGRNWGTEVYDEVIDTAFNVHGHRILSANQFAGIIGVNDIENVHVEGSGYSVFLKWRVTDPENIDMFRVFEGASCFGPFEEAVAIQPGDPQYTSDGEYCAVSLSAPYHREYYFKLRAEYGELTATYQASGIPDFADWVDVGPPPERLLLLAHWSDAELSWDRVWDPWHQATEYWVLRRIGDPIDVFHPHSTWGSFFRGVVPDSSGTCVDPLVALRACWYDDDIAPGATYHYRVASVSRDANGIVMWVSELSEEESGSGWEPGSVEGATERAARLEVSVSPTPMLRGGSAMRLQAAGVRGGDGTVSVYDAIGREVLQQQMGSQLRDGRFTMDLEGKDELRSAGVYFCRVEDDSGQRVERKIVVIR